jgi:hypothetical protein
MSFASAGRAVRPSASINRATRPATCGAKNEVPRHVSAGDLPDQTSFTPSVLRVGRWTDAWRQMPTRRRLFTRHAPRWARKPLRVWSRRSHSDTRRLIGWSASHSQDLGLYFGMPRGTSEFRAVFLQNAERLNR